MLSELLSLESLIIYVIHIGAQQLMMTLSKHEKISNGFIEVM